MAATLAYSRWKGYSMIECFSYRADGWMAGVMRGEVQSSPRFRLYVYCGLAALVAAVLVPLWVYMR